MRVGVASVFTALVLMGTTAISAAEAGVWKTAYVKRGFVGAYEAKWSGGLGATNRMRTPLQYDGSAVRVHVRGAYEVEVALKRMALVKGADDSGRISGSLYPILFSGSPQLTLAAKFASAVSDDISIPITKGTWYVEDQYASEKFPYAYEVDLGYYAPGDAFDQEAMDTTVTCRTGILTRVDVLTTDPQSSIVCYGDSITHGYNSTPNADHRYPSILGRLLKRPVLNLGQNGDFAMNSRHLAATTNEFLGVGTIIYLMGINDLIGGNLTQEKYVEVVKSVIQGAREQQRKVYIGTLPPAGGYADFDADPSKEVLRTAINAWIRKGNGADGIIDFDATLADPKNPTRMQANCQSDWLHPNDLGYQKMAEAAAFIVEGR